MLQPPLITSEQTWALWAILLILAAFGLWGEKTSWGARLSGAIISILGAFLLSNIGIIPATAPAYDLVWSYIVPLAIPLLLLQANLRRILREAGPTLLAFTFGGIGTVLGTYIAFKLIPLGDEGWKLAAIFCSTYVGGSMNYVAASEAVQLRSGDLLTAGVAADNLVMTLYFLLLFALPSVAFLQKHFHTHHEERARATVFDEIASNGHGGGVTLLNLSMGLAIAATICALGYTLQELTGIQGSGILIVTAVTVLMATLFPRQLGALAGVDQVGIFLMQIFFVVIGASAHVMTVVRVGPILFVFAALILFVHLLFLLIAGKLFRLDLAELVIASNANMGGPTTAAAMAVARKWRALVIPAILCGTLGYAIATFIGVGVGLWLR